MLGDGEVLNLGGGRCSCHCRRTLHREGEPLGTSTALARRAEISRLYRDQVDARLELTVLSSAFGPLRSPRVGDYIYDNGLKSYDVAPDRRFLMIKPVAQTEGAGPPRINVVQNFFEELNRLVPN